MNVNERGEGKTRPSFCCDAFEYWVNQQIFWNTQPHIWVMVSFLERPRYIALNYCPYCGKQVGETGVL